MVLTVMNKSRIEKSKQHQLIKHFMDRLSARRAAILTDLNRNTVNLYYQRLREVIAEYADTEFYNESNSKIKKNVEVANSFYGIADTSDTDVPLVGLKVHGRSIFVKEITNTSKLSSSPSFIPDSIIYRNEAGQLIEYNVALAKRHNSVVKASWRLGRPFGQIQEFWYLSSAHSGKISGRFKQESIILRIKVKAWIFNTYHDISIEEIAEFVKHLVAGKLA